MPSETDLLNDALGQIGAARVTAIDDGSTNANHCLTFYPPLRDGLLRGHHWNFIVTRVQLALDVLAPVSGYAYSYALPSDCLKVIDYGGTLPVSAGVVTLDQRYGVVEHYKIEGRKLLSNDGQAFITYLRRETNPDVWDAMFYQAMTAFLASKLASAITKDSKKSMALWQQGETMLSQAMAVDGQENSIEPYIVDDLLWGR